jgi:hypothetical protein
MKNNMKYLVVMLYIMLGSLAIYGSDYSPEKVAEIEELKGFNISSIILDDDDNSIFVISGEGNYRGIDLIRDRRNGVVNIIVAKYDKFGNFSTFREFKTTFENGSFGFIKQVPDGSYIFSPHDNNEQSRKLKVYRLNKDLQDIWVQEVSFTAPYSYDRNQIIDVYDIQGNYYFVLTAWYNYDRTYNAGHWNLIKMSYTGTELKRTSPIGDNKAIRTTSVYGDGTGIGLGISKRTTVYYRDQPDYQIKYESKLEHYNLDLELVTTTNYGIISGDDSYDGDRLILRNSNGNIILTDRPYWHETAKYTDTSTETIFNRSGIDKLLVSKNGIAGVYGNQVSTVGLQFKKYDTSFNEYVLNIPEPIDSIDIIDIKNDNLDRYMVYFKGRKRINTWTYEDTPLFIYSISKEYLEKLEIGYTKIGDNTPLDVSIKTSEDVDRVKILIGITEVYNDKPLMDIRLYNVKEGKNSLHTSGYNSNGDELFIKSNIAIVDKLNALENTLASYKMKGVESKIIILNDSERWYEKNVANDAIVAAIKELGGVYMIGDIYENSQAVLSPLLNGEN